jgi:superfamily II DNA helicase RecQ
LGLRTFGWLKKGEQFPLLGLPALNIVNTACVTQIWTEETSFVSCPLVSMTQSLPLSKLYQLMDPGAGKSLTYQLPATLTPGCTLVISPLVALMRDQLLHLQENDSP